MRRAACALLLLGLGLFATLLMFFVVPATYLAFDRAQERIAAWLGRRPKRAVTR